MATVSHTFTFATTAEGFTATAGVDPTNPATLTYDGSNGDPAGCLSSVLTGRHLAGSVNYWEWTGTWQDLGVPAGATVTGVQLAGAVNEVPTCTLANCDVGPYEVRDGAGNNAVTLWAGRHVTTAEGAWSTVSGSNQSPPSGTSASGSTIKIRLNNSINNGNAGSSVTLFDDQVQVTVTYNPASGPAPFYLAGVLNGNMRSPSGNMS